MNSEAWGKKELLCSLVTQQLILLYPSPNGSRVNRLRQQWVLSSFLEKRLLSELPPNFQGGKMRNERDRFPVMFNPVTPALFSGSTADPAMKTGVELFAFFFSLLSQNHLPWFPFLFFFSNEQQVVCLQPKGDTVERYFIFKQVEFVGGFFGGKYLMFDVLMLLHIPPGL